MSIFQRLYDSEINFEVSCFWDNRFEVKLGDGMNGWDAEANLQSWDEVGPWLDAQARQHYPDSVYAKGQTNG